MLEYEDATKDLLHVIWSGAYTGSEAGYLGRQMATATQIVKLLRFTTAQTTIDDIVDDRLSHFGLIPAETAQSHKDAMRFLVFTVVGWATILYTPIFTSIDRDFSTLTNPNVRSIDTPIQ